MWKWWNDIDTCINRIEKISFLDIFREANQFDDSLAKAGVIRNEFFMAWW